MKILIDLTSLDDNFSGIERYSFNITKAFIELYPEYEYVLVFKNRIFDGFKEICKKKHVRTIVIPSRHKILFQLFVLPMRLYKCDSDICLFPAYPDPLLYFRKNCETIIYDMGCWDFAESLKPLNRIYYRIAFWKSMKHCKELLTVSQFSKNRISSIGHISEEKIHVIYSAPDKKFFPSENREMIRETCLKYKLPECYMMTLSTLAPNKNLSLLLSAYETMFEDKDREIPIDLVLIGRPSWTKENYLKDIPERIQSHIHFTGFVEDDDLPNIYRGANFFVFPSKYEGFGLPPLEAMACGTPVLSSDAASMPEVLGDSAIYCKSDNQQGLVRQLKRN